jgi:hypothetical protein
MANINNLDQYRSYFGFPMGVGTPSTGIVYAIYTIGNLVGSFVAGPATDFRGMFQHLNTASPLIESRSQVGHVHW